MCIHSLFAELPELHPRIRKVLAIIDLTPEYPYSLDELAQEAGMSSTAFCR